MALELVDPTARNVGPPWLFAPLANRLISDPRDVPFVRLMTLQSLLVIPSGLALFVPRLFSWWLAAAHLGLVIYWLGPFVLMLHNTSHRRLFKRPWRFMNAYIPWVLGPFFGESPETYFAHHVGMHHPENNLRDDLSSTMKYQRDSVSGFLRYFLRFFFFVLGDMVRYLRARGRRAIMIKMLVGELGFFALLAALFAYDWRPTLVVFALPFLITRFAMMAGNWAQHAFIDAATPENCYRNSITCINAVYNARCFNDGYHIGHHLKATRHWLEMPDEFLQNLATYEAERALVFRGVDFFGVWLALMLKRYDWLADRVVALGERPVDKAEAVALMRERTRRIEMVEATALAPAE